MRSSTILLVCVTTLVTPSGRVYASRADWLTEDLQRGATHVVVARIVAIAVTDERVPEGSSFESYPLDTEGDVVRKYNYIAEVETVEKSDGSIKECDWIHVEAFQPIFEASCGMAGHRNRDCSFDSQGVSPLPTKGDIVRLYLRNKPRQFLPLFPNGIQPAIRGAGIGPVPFPGRDAPILDWSAISQPPLQKGTLLVEGFALGVLATTLVRLMRFVLTARHASPGATSRQGVDANTVPA